MKRERGTYRHNPMAAIEAGDVLGLEVIPRSELEEVRGEAGEWDLGYGLTAMLVCKASAACNLTSIEAAYLWANRKSIVRYAATGPIGGSYSTTPCMIINGQPRYCN
jgi:hypothetical protein